jgi:hypothetical protein
LQLLEVDISIDSVQGCGTVFTFDRKAAGFDLFELVK